MITVKLVVQQEKLFKVRALCQQYAKIVKLHSGKGSLPFSFLHQEENSVGILL